MWPDRFAGDDSRGKRNRQGAGGPAIHEASPRCKKPFIKVNCAALNENLLESELFGHTKGAYTGAERTRLGRFRGPTGGTIFWMKSGNIPMSTQVKRVADTGRKRD